MYSRSLVCFRLRNPKLSMYRSSDCTAATIDIFQVGSENKWGKAWTPVIALSESPDGGLEAITQYLLNVYPEGAVI